MQYRNLFLLFLCQLISATGSIVLVTLGGILGASLADNPAFATLPVSVMVVSIAATTIPAALLMRRVGRKAGFASASLVAACSVLLAALALNMQSFAVFTAATALFGINMAFTQQYRYAATESMPPARAGRAISLVLLGAIGGALVGSELVTHGQKLAGTVPYTGTLLVLAVLYVVQSVLMLLLGPLRGETASGEPAVGRPLRDIIRQPVFQVAVLGGVAAYGVMTLIMTATPLSMNVTDGFPIEQTAPVIRAHVIGMYLPSLVSGFLIERFGTVRMMLAGIVGLLVSCAIALNGHTIVHYTGALILLGVGWNFLYVGATTMLTFTYATAERFKAQAVNEFAVFGSSATASLLAGTVIYFYGWHALVLLPLPLLLATAIGLYRIRHDAHARGNAPQPA